MKEGGGVMKKLVKTNMIRDIKNLSPLQPPKKKYNVTDLFDRVEFLGQSLDRKL